MPVEPTRTWRFGVFTFDSRRRRLSRAGDPVDLPPKAAELLHLLIESEGRVVEKAEILDALWPDVTVQESNLTQTVYVLRKALGDASESAEFVQTVPRRGYRFVAGATEATDAVEAATVAPPAATAALEPTAGVRPKRWRAGLWSFAALALVLITVTTVWARRPRAIAHVSEEAEPAAITRTGMPANAEALRLYTDGLNRLRVLDATGAAESLERANALDSASPMTRLALSQAWRVLGRDRSAREAAEQAQSLAAGLSPERRLPIEAHGHAVANDWTRAANLYAMLVAQFPGDADFVLALAEAQTRAGQPKEALATIAHAREQPGLDREDPRLDVAEAGVYSALSDRRGETAACERGLARARQRGMQHLEAALLAALGMSKLFQDRRAEAVEDARKARAIYRTVGDRGGEAKALNVIAVSHLTAERFDEAERLFREMLVIGRSLEDTSGTARALNNLGLSLQSQGRSVEARPSLREAIQILHEIEDPRGEARTRLILAQILTGEGLLDEARAELENSLAIQRRTGDVQLQAGSLVDLAVVAREQGRFDDARASVDEGMRLVASSGNRTVELESALDRFDVLVDMGQAEAARHLLEEVRQARLESGDQAGLLLAELGRAELLLDAGQAVQAEPLARAAWDHSKRSAGSFRHCQTAGVLGRALGQLGRRDEARRILDEALKASWQGGWHILHAYLRTYRARLEAIADGQRAVTALEQVLEEARRRGWQRVALEASLALGEVEVKVQPAQGRARLASLTEEARQKGFAGLAGRAERALGDTRAAQAAR